MISALLRRRVFNSLAIGVPWVRRFAGLDDGPDQLQLLLTSLSCLGRNHFHLGVVTSKEEIAG